MRYTVTVVEISPVGRMKTIEEKQFYDMDLAESYRFEKESVYGSTIQYMVMWKQELD